MNFSKTFIFALGSLILLLLIGTLYVLMQTKKDTFNFQRATTVTLSTVNPRTNATTSLNAISQMPHMLSDTIQIPTAEGGTLEVLNFTKILGVASTSGASFTLSWFPDSETKTLPSLETPYEIYYYPENKFFIAVIFKEPIGEIRRKIADDLKGKLGITNADLCSLVAEVTVPYSVNVFYGAQNLGFPNCPSAVKFDGDTNF